MAVGARFVAAGNAGDPRPADHPDRHAVPDAEDDAATGRRPVAAEDDDDYAPVSRVYLLLPVVGAGAILLNWQPGGHSPAVADESWSTARTCAAGGSNS